jgi:hypothetical protein
MRQWIRSHLRFANVVSVIALFVALGGTTYAASGGNFILGKSNSAGAPTQLSSPTTNSAGALKVTNTSSTNAGRAITAAGGAGGYGLYATGGNHSKGTAAIHGQSSAGNAVEGFTTANPASGVYGQDNKANSYGVAGHSDNGVAVVGDSSNGWAMQALGNASQTRTGNGFVKAMAHVVPGAADPIQECFNSQLPPGQAAGGDCGITYTGSQAGQYSIGFGFKVSDRIASVTPLNPRKIADAHPGSLTTFNIDTYDDITNQYTNQPFYIVVY